MKKHNPYKTKRSNVIIYLLQPRTKLESTNISSMEKYVQHNMGAVGFDGSEDERYLTFETEKRLEATTSTLSFQSFEMKEKNGSTISKVRTLGLVDLYFSVVNLGIPLVISSLLLLLFCFYFLCQS